MSNRIYLTVEIDADLREKMRMSKELTSVNWSAWVRRSICNHIEEVQSRAKHIAQPANNMEGGAQ
jgi:hypothetical protein